MNQKNPKREGFGQGQANVDSGFGGSAFGGGGGSQFGGGGAGGGSEFGGGFGGTNAVSQIFKDGGFDDGKKKQAIIVSAAVAALLVCGGAAWWLFSGDEAEKEVKVEAPVAAQPAVQEAPASDEEVEEADDVAAAPEAVNQSTVTYDARQGGILISTGSGAHVEVSRRADFTDHYVSGVAKDGKFRIPLPPPGKIYWRVQGSQESSAITVLPPPSLGIRFAPPASLTKDAQLTWSASGPVSYYKVEFSSDESFSNVVSAIATAQTSASAQELDAGKYYVRVGGLNLASGTWEFSNASNVTVE